VSGRKVSPGLARTRMTRRGVLTVGGLTLVTGYLLGPAKQSASNASAHDARGTSTHPASPELASPRVASPRVASQKSTNGSPLYYVNDGPKGIALTIDDGPSPVYTPQVLAILEQYRVTATFSMIGLEVDAHPGVARDVAAAGHVIANHTWSHIDLASLKAATVADQLNQATDAIHKATGTVPELFRAPYGAWSAAVLRQCAKTGMTPVDWSVDPRDWARPGVNSIVRNIMRNTKTGSIILEHDGGGNRSETVAALKVVIPRLLDAGYRFYAV
jgi:peptidoglycan/xylan/chitin deacetylase (PgdA/CDA1 family)